jgi:aspartate aminotransferase
MLKIFNKIPQKINLNWSPKINLLFLQTNSNNYLGRKMNIRKSGAKYSAIVGIGEQLRQMSKETGNEYLYLNRGVNAVTNINLSEIIPLIDFNSNDIQVYPPNNGRPGLRNAINDYYFQSSTSPDNIFITNGGMGGLDLIIKTLDVEKIFISKYYWGAYTNIMKINHTPFESYADFEFLNNNIDKLKGCAVIICDPNNPVGDKHDDERLMNLVSKLNDNGVIVIWDSPYRLLFADKSDTLYKRLLQFSNVIIAESFSKSLGLSGQRIGFVHTTNKDYNSEFNTNLLYATNGINAFAQILVEKLLSTEEGLKASKDFRENTVKGIEDNIKYLDERKLLASEFYSNSKPIGIFVIVNKSFDELLEHKIGSVSLSFFTQANKDEAAKYARICASVSHKKFKTFFDAIH